MKKLATFASVAVLAAAAGQASAAVYALAGTNSGGVSYAEITVPGAGVTSNWDATSTTTPPSFIGTHADTQVQFQGLDVVMYVTGGSYDDTTGQGYWDYTVDLSGFGSGQHYLTITNQTFTIDASTGAGTLNGDGHCVGDFGGCLGLAPSFQGEFNASITPVGAGANTFSLIGSQAGDVNFAVTLETPVPASAWLFGSALIGLAGVGRRRKA